MLLLGLVFGLAFNSTAQETDPIFDLLTTIPDTPTSRDIITLVDRDSIVLAYPDAIKPANGEALLVAATGDDNAPDGEKLWWRVFSQLGDESAQVFQFSEILPERLGIDFMEISASATFGTPPDDSLVLQGAFDTATIEAALTAREYTQTESGVWCEEDCESGMEANFDRREPGDPFGGELGRTQPFVIGDNFLMSSPNATIAEAVQGLQAGESISLADDPAYQAVATALSAEGVVVQVTFVDGETLLKTSLGFAPENAPLEKPEGYVEIMPYRLFAIADVATEGEQVGVSAFVYNTEADATAALEQMQFRLSTLESFVNRRSFQSILDDRNVTVTSEVVPVGDLFVGVLRFSTPKGTMEQILAASLATPSDVEMPGLIYLRLLYGSLVQRGDQWRWWG
jgi:hypothetical protein